MKKQIYKLIIVLNILALSVSCAAGKKIYLSPSEGNRIEKKDIAVSDTALIAEGDEDWSKALDIYLKQVENGEGSARIWTRIAHIYIKLDDLTGAVNAFRKSLMLDPGDPAIWYELSRTLSVMNNPEEAWKAINKAIRLDTENTEYLEAGARLANWNGRYGEAAGFYRKLIRLLPAEKVNTLHFARAEAWSGNLDRSVRLYRDHIKQNMDDKPAYIETVRTELWRGNYKNALETLRNYGERFGEDIQFQRALAEIFSRGNKPARAGSLIDALDREISGDYEVLYSKAVSLRYANRIREAREILEELKIMRPGTVENRNLEDFINIPSRSNAGSEVSYYSDSDDIRITGLNIRGGIFIMPDLEIKLSAGSHKLKVNTGSPFSNIDGSIDATHKYFLIGGKIRIFPAMSFSVSIGNAEADDSHSATVYELAAGIRVTDDLTFRAERRKGYFVISPRAVSLGILRTDNRLILNYHPGFSYLLDVYGTYTVFSDDNKFRELIFFPKRVITRSGNLNMELGFRGWWFGYSDSPGNGYWAPEFFQSYMGAVTGYLKMNRNNGISFQGAAGVLKDNTMDHFEFGYSIDTEGFFGIYRDLMLKIRGSYMHNIRQSTGAFSAYLVSAGLTLRL